MRIVHLDPEEQLPSRMIVVGDPERAKMIAEKVLSGSKLINKKRGFLIYSGNYGGGSLGVGVHLIGSPSTAIFLEELYKLGVRMIIRIGSVGSLDKSMGIGKVIVPPASIPASPGGIYSQYYPRGCPPNAHTPELLVGLIENLRIRGIDPIVKLVISSEAFYAEDNNFIDYWVAKGAVGVEMECSTLAMLGWLRGFKQACALVVSNFVGGEEHVDTKNLWPVYERVAHSVANTLIGV